MARIRITLEDDDGREINGDKCSSSTLSVDGLANSAGRELTFGATSRPRQLTLSRNVEKVDRFYHIEISCVGGILDRMITSPFST